MNKTGLSLSLGAHAPGRMDGHQRNGVPLWWAQSEAAFALRLRTWPPLEKSLLPGAKAGKGAGGNRSTLAGRPARGLSYTTGEEGQWSHHGTLQVTGSGSGPWAS